MSFRGIGSRVHTEYVFALQHYGLRQFALLPEAWPCVSDLLIVFLLRGISELEILVSNYALRTIDIKIFI